MIYTKRIHPDVPAPERKTDGSAGFDISAPFPIYLHPGEQQMVPTGHVWELPEGSVGILCPRSSMARKGLQVLRDPQLGGIIDSDYRGELIACINNVGDRPIDIPKGERFCQLLVLAMHPKALMTHRPEEVEELSATARGDGGFGSTN